MDLVINYGSVAKSNALETHITRKIHQIENMSHLDESRVTVWLNKESSLMSRGLPQFQARLEVKKPGKSSIMAEAKSNHLVMCVNQAAKRIKKRLKREGGKSEKTYR